MLLEKLDWRVRIKLVLTISIFAYLLLVYCFTFNYEIEINECFYLLAYSTIVSLLFFLMDILHRERISIIRNLLYFFILSFLVYRLLSNSLFSNEHLCATLSIILLVVGVLDFDSRGIQFTWLSLFFFYLFEIFVGLIQLLQQMEYEQYSITGTLENSGVYSIFIITCLPLGWFYLIYYKNSSKQYWRMICLGLLFCLTFVFAIINKSRTGILLFTLTSFILFAPLLKRKIFESHRRVARIILVLTFMFFLFFAYTVVVHFSSQKMLSTSGRFLMLEVTRNHLTDDFWFGIGLGNFSFYYPTWQAEYFLSKDHSVSLNYFLSAGETYMVFNEYILLFKEIGLIGFTFISLAIFIILKMKPMANDKLSYSVKIILLSILASALFYYSFHIGSILFLFLFGLVSLVKLKIGNSENVRFFSRRKHGAFVVFNFIFLITLSTVFLRTAISTMRWERLRADEHLNHIEKLSRFRALFEDLKHNGKFLVEYAEILSNNHEDYAKSLEVLEGSMKLFISYRSVETMAIVSKLSGNNKKSIDLYRFLIGFVPSRFSPRLELAKLYLISGDLKNAINTSEYILQMPIKIPSEEVTQIRRAAERIIGFVK